MRNGRHAHFSRRRSSRPVALILSLVLVLGLAIGGTVAYLVTKTNPVNNTFSPTDVSCEVVNTNNGIRVKNTGSIDAYIRVYVTANYVNTSGHICAAHTATVPTPDSQYWTSGEGGFYYYNSPVASGDVTPALFATPAAGTPLGDGCTLKIKVFASAIQTGDAAVSAWKGN